MEGFGKDRKGRRVGTGRGRRAGTGRGREYKKEKKRDAVLRKRQEGWVGCRGVEGEQEEG